jgi:O-antigen/teichoic acid export membrane protein
MEDVRELFVVCFPIFISTFLSLFLYNIPKYAIDFYLTEDIQTYYSVLFMPSFIVTLFSDIITRPLLTSIAIAWDEDLARFTSLTKNIYLLILVGTVCVVPGGHYIGRWMLELIYGVDLSPFKLEFVILLIGGGLSAAVYITYNILISIRAQRFIIVGYLGVALLAIPLTYLAVGSFGMMGAACSYLLTCLALEIVFASVLLMQMLNKRRGGCA